MPKHNNEITQGPGGAWRVGKGRAIYRSKEEAERALYEKQGQHFLDVRSRAKRRSMKDVT